MDEQLYHAVLRNLVEKVRDLLKDKPGLDVNGKDHDHRTALHNASSYSHHEIVRLLLAHPTINVNLQTSDGYTPFSLCCYSGSVSMVRVLLKDPRVDIILPDDENGCSPLWWASFMGQHEVVEWLIASGRDLGDLDTTGRDWDGKEFSAIEIARDRRRSKVVSLLERFKVDPTQTRHEICVKLGVLDELAAELFALVVFLCDDLLQLKPAPTTSLDARRFFTITAALPMELQMLLCHYVSGTGKQNIMLNDSEAAFCSLARILVLSQSK